MHVGKEASIPDHRVEFFLRNDIDPNYQEKSQRNQEDTGEQCEVLNQTFMETENSINCCHVSSDDERDEAFLIMQPSKLAIRSWQCHIL